MKAAVFASLGEFHGVLSHCDNEMTWTAPLHSPLQKHMCSTRVKMRKSYFLSLVPKKHTFNILLRGQ